MRALAEHGHEVVAFDNLCTGHEYLAAGFPLIKGDIADAALLATVLKDVDAVMHFAAHAYVGESVTDPRKYFDNNIRRALTLLDTIIGAGVRKLVFSSSCAVYGVPATLPIDETTPRDPINPYGVSKMVFERMLEAYDRAYGLRSLSLRYFNAAGAHPSGIIGEDHSPETHLIPLALQAASGERRDLKIFGDAYATPDGTCLRDYIHVCDLAEAHVRALNYLAAGSATTAVNVGTGTGSSVMQVIDTVEKVAGRKFPFQIASARPGDPPVLVASCERAKQVLGFQPRYTLFDMVSSAWRWHSSRQKRAVAATV
jgi:UDP-glucose-4-epimerase GalE